MLTHPTVDKLHELRCPAMARALTEQLASPLVQNLSFEERLGLIVDREITERHSRQLTNRLRRAKLRHAACIEDIDFRQTAWTGQGPRPVARQRTLGPRAPQRPHHRSGRRGKDLDRLRACP